MNAKDKLHTMDAGKLCEMYEMLSGKTDMNTAMVRGWLMDELERRNPEAFDAWIDCDDLIWMESPSKFFC